MIVQGRYDLLCPPATSHALSRLWPDARIVMAEVSGHSLSHPAVHHAVRTAIASFDGSGFVSEQDGDESPLTIIKANSQD